MLAYFLVQVDMYKFLHFKGGFGFSVMTNDFQHGLTIVSPFYELSCLP
jgi:hypothetical protein